jgi:hypothetical protein
VATLLEKGREGKVEEVSLRANFDEFCLLPKTHEFLQFPIVLIVGGCIVGHRNARRMQNTDRDRVRFV